MWWQVGTWTTGRGYVDAVLKHDESTREQTWDPRYQRCIVAQVDSSAVCAEHPRWREKAYVLEAITAPGSDPVSRLAKALRDHPGARAGITVVGDDRHVVLWRWDTRDLGLCQRIELRADTGILPASAATGAALVVGWVHEYRVARQRWSPWNVPDRLMVRQHDDAIIDSAPWSVLALRSTTVVCAPADA